MLLLLFVTIFSSTVTLADATHGQTSFVCEDGAGASYAIELGKIRKTLVITERGKTAKTVTLSEANAGMAGGGGKSMVYNRWNKSGADLYERLDTSTELVTRYEGNAIELALFLDHQKPMGLRCRSGKVAATVIVPEFSVDRLVSPLLDAAEQRGDDGQLKPVVVLRWEALLKRYAVEAKATDRNRMDELVHFVGPALLATDPTSIGRIGGRLGTSESQYWQELLRSAKYRDHAAIDRYIDWAKAALARRDGNGARKPDPNGLRVAVSRVLQSKKEWRDRFQRELEAPLKELTAAEKKGAFAALKGEQRTFLSSRAPASSD